jgi:hypothetical protein
MPLAEWHGRVWQHLLTTLSGSPKERTPLPLISIDVARLAERRRSLTEKINMPKTESEWWETACISITIQRGGCQISL